MVLIDRRNVHLLHPLLCQVATAGLGLEQISELERAILRGQRNLEFRLTEVHRIDLASRSLHTSSGHVGCDYLIPAPGGAAKGTSTCRTVRTPGGAGACG